MQKEMIRFGNVKNNRKAVLATLKQEGHIYFGIARCNFKAGDRFDKNVGKKMAQGRALKAFSMAQEPGFKPDAPEGFDISQTHTFYMYGRVKETDIKKLLEYFHSLG